jgi:hypothetical protein
MANFTSLVSLSHLGGALHQGIGRIRRHPSTSVDKSVNLGTYMTTRGRRRRGRPRAVEDQAARKRIAELERKVFEHALEIDFFRKALRHVKAPPPSTDGRGAAASSRSSTR